jgi:hypothetical protein
LRCLILAHFEWPAMHDPVGFAGLSGLWCRVAQFNTAARPAPTRRSCRKDETHHSRPRTAKSTSLPAARSSGSFFPNKPVTIEGGPVPASAGKTLPAISLPATVHASICSSPSAVQSVARSPRTRPGSAATVLNSRHRRPEAWAPRAQGPCNITDTSLWKGCAFSRRATSTRAHRYVLWASPLALGEIHGEEHAAPGIYARR